MSFSLVGCSLDPSNAEKEQPEETPVSSQVSGDEVEKEEPASSVPQNDSEDESSEQSEQTNDDVVARDGTVTVNNPESLNVVVNKERKLPSNYIPEDLTVPDVPFSFSEFAPKKQMRKEAAQALEELFTAAQQDGLDLVAASGYRSYDRQKQIYDRNVDVYGKEETDKFSARPGTSEHQTGLAMDVTSAQMAFKLNQSFGKTDEGEWLAEHAHEYGFVIRYIKGSEDITGYTYEPWHLRYVGKQYSTDVYEQELTLEEFFGFHPVSE
ncbi:D-alanyl-D-alanine carboxypeptidase family protein [Halobacillus litoralis]|uniref:M15 family metallopeptidase n=1 Tax=Halobacillus litoralis TaxID=45668 RepID=UPI001CFDBF7C|nr:M15 family metallopeptidase [Halobacillus litoralis]